MGYRAAVWCAVAVLCGAAVNAQTVTATFQLQDPMQFFGTINMAQVPLNQSNATFTPSVIYDANHLPLSVAFEVVGTTPANTEDWIFNFTNGGKPAPPGTYPVGVAGQATASLQLVNGQLCTAQNGTVGLTNVTTDVTTGTTTQVQLTFSLDCGTASSVTGSFSYLSSSGTGGSGGGTGGSGGGGGSVSTGAGRAPGLGNFPIGGGTSTTPTTPTTPAAPALTVSGPLTVTNVSSGQTTAVTLTASGNSTFASDVTFSASGPEGLTFAFNPATIASPGSGSTTLTLGTSGSLQTGLQRVEVVAQGANGVIGRTAFNIFVTCDPPLILGIDQPRNTTIASGMTATLTVKTTGSGPFTYQWYEGHRGSTLFPVSGATGATFVTPTLTDGIEYWVRVSNPCGSVDSQNAQVFVTG